MTSPPGSTKACASQAGHRPQALSSAGQGGPGTRAPGLPPEARSTLPTPHHHPSTTCAERPLAHPWGSPFKGWIVHPGFPFWLRRVCNMLHERPFSERAEVLRTSSRPLSCRTARRQECEQRAPHMPIQRSDIHVNHHSLSCSTFQSTSRPRPSTRKLRGRRQLGLPPSNLTASPTLICVPPLDSDTPERTSRVLSS
jgi:hypothetical protein